MPVHRLTARFACACHRVRAAFPPLVVLAIAISSSLAVTPASSQPPQPSKPIHSGPCSTPECHQFDFWVGDWNVYTPDGKLAGTNKVERILRGCAIQENWSGERGTDGKSLNSYSASDHKWHQTWVDSEGSRLDLAGSFADGKMVLEGESATSGGGSVHNRITWEPLADGRVKQHWEVSTDGEKWSDAFVGIYKPKSVPQTGGKAR